MGGLRLGRLLGVPIELRYSFLLLFALAYYLGVARGVGGWVAVLLLVMCLSVLVHELAHALAARRIGVPVVLIDLHFFGGAVRLARMPTHGQEVAIGLAGPAVSLLLALAGELLFQATHWHPLNYFCAMNLMLGALNLVPVLPLDGGRVLRATLVGFGHDLYRATAICVKLSKILLVLFAAGALWYREPLAVIIAAHFWLCTNKEIDILKRWQPVAPATLGWDPTTQTKMSVLDEAGKPSGRKAAPLGTTYIIEEHTSDHGQRWVVRGEDGQVLLVTDTPLR